MGNPDPELSTQQYHEIADGHRMETWTAQQEAFTGIRDLCDRVAADCRTELEQLRQSWSGAAAERFTGGFEEVITAIEQLRDSAASNHDGMREIAVVIGELVTESGMLRDEDAAWESNGDGDDAETVHRARESVKGELRDRIEESADECERLAASYLLSPPEIPQPGIPAESPGRPSPKSDSGPELQSGPAEGHTAAAAAPRTEVPTSSTSASVMAMGGVDATGGKGTRGSRAREGRPSLEDTRQRSRGRMRSDASRQERHNRERHGEFRPHAARQSRRAGDEENDSPFAPSDPTVVPPVVTGDTPVVGPHDSGPVLTDTAYRRFPEYTADNEPPRRIDRDYADGTRASVELTSGASPDSAAGRPTGSAAAETPLTPSGKASDNPADTSVVDSEARRHESPLSEQRRLRREAREQRRRDRDNTE